MLFVVSRGSNGCHRRRVKEKFRMLYQIYPLLASLSSRIRREGEDESGQGLAEYGLILALIAVVAIGALTGLGGAISTKIGAVTTAL